MAISCSHPKPAFATFNNGASAPNSNGHDGANGKASPSGDSKADMISASHILNADIIATRGKLDAGSHSIVFAPYAGYTIVFPLNRVPHVVSGNWLALKSGDTAIRVTYVCGNFERVGPWIERSRLLRFSNRASNEMQKGQMTWEVRCQHFKQFKLFDELFAWFMRLENRVYPPPKSQDDHPRLDPCNEWIEDLNWENLFLLLHSFDYMHVHAPLDGRRIRSEIFRRLKLNPLHTPKIEPEVLHDLFQLLQFKSKWVAEQKNASSPAHPSFTGSKSKYPSDAISSSYNDKAQQILEHWDDRNRALIIRVCLHVVKRWRTTHDVDADADAYFTALVQLRDRSHDSIEYANEDNDLLIEVLTLAYDFIMASRIRRRKNQHIQQN